MRSTPRWFPDLRSQSDALFADSEFQWWVSDHVHYEASARGRTLVDETFIRWHEKSDPRTDTSNGRFYAPLSVKDLFLVFAGTELTRHAVLAFARKYGLLGISDAYRGTLYRERVGEHLRDWRKEMGFMRLGVALWEMVEARDTAALGREFRWGSSKRFRVLGRPVTGWLFRDGDMPIFPFDATFSPDDILSPARWVINRLATVHLGNLSVFLGWNERERRTVLRIMPVDLLSAMWLQFARAVTGEATYRRCKVCGTWMTVSKDDDGVRADREFCSGACKQKDHRTRVNEAKRRRAEGQTVPQIAKQLNTTTEIVKRWLTKGK
jgi:hypothetical protein